MGKSKKCKSDCAGLEVNRCTRRSICRGYKRLGKDLCRLHPGFIMNKRTCITERKKFRNANAKSKTEADRIHEQIENRKTTFRNFGKNILKNNFKQIIRQNREEDLLARGEREGRQREIRDSIRQVQEEEQMRQAEIAERDRQLREDADRLRAQQEAEAERRRIAEAEAAAIARANAEREAEAAASAAEAARILRVQQAERDRIERQRREAAEFLLRQQQEAAALKQAEADREIERLRQEAAEAADLALFAMEAAEALNDLDKQAEKAANDAAKAEEQATVADSTTSILLAAALKAADEGQPLTKEQKRVLDKAKRDEKAARAKAEKDKKAAEAAEEAAAILASALQKLEDKKPLTKDEEKAIAAVERERKAALLEEEKKKKKAIDEAAMRDKEKIKKAKNILKQAQLVDAIANNPLLQELSKTDKDLDAISKTLKAFSNKKDFNPAEHSSLFKQIHDTRKTLYDQSDELRLLILRENHRQVRQDTLRSAEFRNNDTVRNAIDNERNVVPYSAMPVGTYDRILNGIKKLAYDEDRDGNKIPSEQGFIPNRRFVEYFHEFRTRTNGDCFYDSITHFKDEIGEQRTDYNKDTINAKYTAVSKKLRNEVCLFYKAFNFDRAFQIAEREERTINSLYDIIQIGFVENVILYDGDEFDHTVEICKDRIYSEAMDLATVSLLKRINIICFDDTMSSTHMKLYAEFKSGPNNPTVYILHTHNHYKALTPKFDVIDEDGGTLVSHNPRSDRRSRGTQKKKR